MWEVGDDAEPAGIVVESADQTLTLVRLYADAS
jgi:hypothetical protein